MQNHYDSSRKVTYYESGTQATPNLIGELEYLYGLYYWPRKRVLERKRFREIHLLMLRRAILEERLPFSRILKATGREKQDVSKARRFLQRSGLVSPRRSKSDKRARELSITSKGATVLKELDLKIEANLLASLSVEDRADLGRFAAALQAANSLIPGRDPLEKRHYADPRDYQTPTIPAKLEKLPESNDDWMKYF